MSTVAEIEQAIRGLSPGDLRRVEATLHHVQRQQTKAIKVDAPEYHDLDSLIGSWKEDAEFDAAIRAFEQVDEAMWK